MARMVVLGGINIDLVVRTPRFPRPGETVVGRDFFTTPGGKGANQAVACARLGARTALVGRVGADLFGPGLLRDLGAEGVDTAGVATDPEAPSGVALIAVDDRGQNQIIQAPGANARCGPGEVEAVARALEGADLLLLQLEVPPEVSLESARRARAKGVGVVFNPAPAKPFPPALLDLTDWLTPNETEAEALVGFPVAGPGDAERAVRALLERAPLRGVVVTLGEQGAVWGTREGEGYVPAFPVQAVDTVGAGDAFTAGLAVALAEGLLLAEAVRFACACGAVCVTRPGAQVSMPRREEVDALLRGPFPV